MSCKCMSGKYKKYISCRIKAAVIIASLYMLTASLLLFTGQLWVGIPCLYLAGTLLTAWGIYKMVAEPYHRYCEVMQAFAAGQVLQMNGCDICLSPEQESMIDRFNEMLNMNEVINATRKQAEYMALQNQINPHFLYNTLEGIRGETLHAGLNHVAKMTEALATFFRYTISNMDNLVTLEDEMENIDNYYIIQRYRFGDRITLKTEYSEEDAERILRCKLPKLTLQPIVENAVCHGVEQMIGNGIITIRVDITDDHMIIKVSDNGIGMPEERVKELNHKLNELKTEYIKDDHENKGGIAMVNVNNRIRLLCGEEYGIYIYSIPQVGTDVEITLPVIEGDSSVLNPYQGVIAL